MHFFPTNFHDFAACGQPFLSSVSRRNVSPGLLLFTRRFWLEF